jgi:hypothetical protein
VFDAGVVDEIAHLKIIGPVDDQVAILYQALDIRIINVRNDSFDPDLGIDFGDPIFGCHGLREPVARILLAVESLPLEIGKFDKIAIYYPQSAHTCAGKHFGVSRSERPAAHEQDMRVEQFLLPFFSDFAEKDLPAVAFVHLVRLILFEETHSSHSLP